MIGVLFAVVVVGVGVVVSVNVILRRGRLYKKTESGDC